MRCVFAFTQARRLLSPLRRPEYERNCRHSRTVSIGPFPVATFAVGAIAGLPAAVAGIGAQNVLVVTDQGLRDTPLIKHIVALLDDAGIAVALFAGVHPNPSTDDIDAGGIAARASRAHAIVSVGGGSAMDGAKGIALSATNDVPGIALGWGLAQHPGLPLIAVPTTAGTGAECNDFGVITNSSSHRKFYVGAASCLAKAVILDPALTISLPPGPTAASGMDCLTHAVESFLSIRPNAWADGLDLQVVRLVSRNLRRAYAEGTDIEARSNMLLAAHTASQAMSTTGLGIVHGIGHPLGGRHDIAHGVALSLLLGECLRFSRPVRIQRLAQLAEPLDVGVANASDARNADAAIIAIQTLADDVNMPHSLAGFDVGTQDLPALAEDALADVVMVNTPRQPTAADVLQILTAIL
jgi:alcohol dehydrogenase